MQIIIFILPGFMCSNTDRYMKIHRENEIYFVLYFIMKGIDNR